MSIHRSDQPAHEWPYWRNKHGWEEALEEYYPERLATDRRLSAALAAAQNARAAVETVFAALSDDSSVSATGSGSRAGA